MVKMEGGIGNRMINNGIREERIGIGRYSDTIVRFLFLLLPGNSIQLRKRLN